MTTVKSPAIFESPPVAGDAAPSSALSPDETPEPTSEQLTALLRDCIEHGFGRYVELDIGGFDEPSIERCLYQLLGVVDSTELLFGISAANDGDLAYCRADHGDPHYRVTLAPEPNPSLDWEIWRAPASSLWTGSLAGASLILPAHNPGWAILTHPFRGNPWLFPTHS